MLHRADSGGRHAVVVAMKLPSRLYLILLTNESWQLNANSSPLSLILYTFTSPLYEPIATLVAHGAMSQQMKKRSGSSARIVRAAQKFECIRRRSSRRPLKPACWRKYRAAKFMPTPDTLFVRESGHLCGTIRSNGGHVDMGFMQSACWFVKYSVIIVSSVIFFEEEFECAPFGGWVRTTGYTACVGSTADICFCSDRCCCWCWFCCGVWFNCCGVDFFINLIGGIPDAFKSIGVWPFWPLTSPFVSIGDCSLASSDCSAELKSLGLVRMRERPTGVVGVRNENGEWNVTLGRFNWLLLLGKLASFCSVFAVSVKPFAMKWS